MDAIIKTWRLNSRTRLKLMVLNFKHVNNYKVLVSLMVKTAFSRATDILLIRIQIRLIHLGSMRLYILTKASYLGNLLVDLMSK